MIFLIFIAVMSSSVYAYCDCANRDGTYILTYPQANFETRLKVEQKSCQLFDLETVSDGEVAHRQIIVDGKPHITYSSPHEVITETFSPASGGSEVSYYSEDNYSWGERFINKGLITQGPQGQWIEEYSQYRWDGIYLFTTNLIYSKVN